VHASRVIQLHDVQKPQEKLHGEACEAHFIAVYDHYPVLNEVGDEAVLLDHAHDPVYHWIYGWLVIQVVWYSKFLLVLHDLKSNIDNWTELPVFSKCEQEGRVLVKYSLP
jgi:hypothetical protein